jgi:hypothetical protein
MAFYTDPFKTSEAVARGYEPHETTVGYGVF